MALRVILRTNLAMTPSTNPAPTETTRRPRVIRWKSSADFAGAVATPRRCRCEHRPGTSKRRNRRCWPMARALKRWPWLIGSGSTWTRNRPVPNNGSEIAEYAAIQARSARRRPSPMVPYGTLQGRRRFEGARPPGKPRQATPRRGPASVPQPWRLGLPTPARSPRTRLENSTLAAREQTRRERHKREKVDCAPRSGFRVGRHGVARTVPEREHKGYASASLHIFAPGDTARRPSARAP